MTWGFKTWDSIGGVRMEITDLTIMFAIQHTGPGYTTPIPLGTPPAGMFHRISDGTNRAGGTMTVVGNDMILGGTYVGASYNFTSYLY